MAATSDNLVTRKFPKNSLESLVKRVRSGEVVFFIGAGFSLDSEGHSADALMRRLVVRFFALVKAVMGHLNDTVDREKKWRKEVVTTLETFHASFRIKPDVFWDEHWVIGNAWKKLSKEDTNFFNNLSDKYYEANDWFCNVYDFLLGVLGELADIEHELFIDIQHYEDELLAQFKDMGYTAPIMGPLNSDLAKVAYMQRGQRNKDAGKAMFLDAMGFRGCSKSKKDSLMAGNACAPDIKDVLRSYRGLLYPRHWVLARLAREGWCKELITTNYDKLLEGAYRLVGFADGKEKTDSQYELPPTPFPYWSTIASPEDFFSQQYSQRAALLLKMHGCSERYDTLTDCSFTGDEWSAYLKSMVFTYREIQNWREDAWSRDYVRSLLRSRIVTMCCYSAQDPVVHDTFRTVYEEMARYNREEKRNKAYGEVDEDDSENGKKIAPAFYFGSQGNSSDKVDFHGMEVLRAASSAVGHFPDPPVQHEQYVRYTYLDKKDPERGAFGNLDDKFLWLNHRVYRQTQRECLQAELGQLCKLMHGKVPSYQQQEVIEAFDAICEREINLTEEWKTGGSFELRKQLRQVTDWSYRFHPLLLREFAMAELMRSKGEHAGVLGDVLGNPHWYYPATGTPMWTAVGVLVELALRKRIAVISCEKNYTNPAICKVGDAPHPTLSFIQSNQVLPTTLQIVMSQPSRKHKVRTPREGCFNHVVWKIDRNESPWIYRDEGKESTEDDSSESLHDPREQWSWRQWRSNKGVEQEGGSQKEIAAPPLSDIWKWIRGENTTLDTF